ncbi:MAG: hypothetical protein C0504_12560 [Candidatus Solibacter sp.]|nr:hypothetical protein [Candidatus Solibacter sp.]
MRSAFPSCVLRGLCILVCVAGLFPLSALPIFDNGGYGGYQIGRYNSNNGSSSNWRIFEDFTLLAPATVDGIWWQQHDRTASSGFTTTISFFNGTPAPGTMIASYSVVATRTANALPVLFGSYAGYDYLVTGLNLPLMAGTYYFSINNDVPNTTWDQTTGSLSTIPGRWQGTSPYFPASSHPSENSVFQILGPSGPVAIPEPGTFALLACGLAGLAYRRFRRG